MPVDSPTEVAAPPTEVAALQDLIRIFSSFDTDTQLRLLKTVTTFLDIKGIRIAGAGEVRISDFVSPQKTGPSQYDERPYTESGSLFSDRPNISAKEFLMDKEPRSDVERVTCLAYYLTHYANTRHFKTLDITKLNTDAAQRKLSNAADSVDNATKAGLLVPAVKGTKQLSAMGEQYVRALPDREAAAQVRAKYRPRRSKKPVKTSD